MPHRKSVQLIRDAYQALEVLNNITWTAYRDHICSMALAEEKRHRSPAREDYRWHLSQGDAAKLFTVKRVAEALLNPNLYTIRDAIRVQQSAIYAASVVANYHDVCKQALAAFDLQALVSIDYAALVEGKE